MTNTSKNRGRIFIKKTQKAEIHFGLLNIESKGTFSRTQITHLLSKWENMTEKWVHDDLSECGTRKGSSKPIFWPNEFSAL